jgi:hypothetical protein
VSQGSTPIPGAGAAAVSLGSAVDRAWATTMGVASLSAAAASAGGSTRRLAVGEYGATPVVGDTLDLGAPLGRLSRQSSDAASSMWTDINEPRTGVSWTDPDGDDASASGSAALHLHGLVLCCVPITWKAPLRLHCALFQSVVPISFILLHKSTE